MNLADVQALLRDVPHFRDIRAVTPLSGGITNCNYRLTTASGEFVLRIAGANTSALGIDRHREHACAQTAAAIGIGAEVVAFLPDAHALVSRFLVGQTLSTESIRTPGVLPRAVHALRAWHSAPSIPGVFSPFQVIEEYRAIATSHGVPLPADFDVGLAEILSLENDLGDVAVLVPCHNDLLPGNLIDDAQAIRLIDWEYAAMGNRFFDLGNFAENHDLSPALEVELLRHYFGSVAPADLLQLRRMRRVSAMREALWGFAQAGISQLDFDFQAYAADHWRRFWYTGGTGDHLSSGGTSE